MTPEQTTIEALRDALKYVIEDYDAERDGCVPVSVRRVDVIRAIDTGEWDQMNQAAMDADVDRLCLAE